jgi:hypothetical protein
MARWSFRRLGEGSKNVAMVALGNRQVRLGSTIVENPLFQKGYEEDKTNPREIAVLVNLRESAVVSLSVRGKLEPHQVAAADHFRAAWEIVSGMRRPNMGQPTGQRLGRSFTVKLVQAGHDLQAARLLLGQRCYGLVVMVCGEGKSLAEVGRGKRGRLTAADNLRASLDDLAILWGLGSHPRNHAAGTL